MTCPLIPITHVNHKYCSVFFFAKYLCSIIAYFVSNNLKQFNVKLKLWLCKKNYDFFTDLILILLK